MKKYIAFAFISLCLVTAKSFSQVVRQLPSGISNTRETVIKSVIPPRKDELPLEQLLKSGGSGSFQVVKHNNDMPLEIGYTFQASKKGVIYSVGIILPNLMDTYTISIWDAATQTLLLRKEVGMATLNGFSYTDLQPANEQLEIQANKSYVISVYLGMGAGFREEVIMI